MLQLDFCHTPLPSAAPSNRPVPRTLPGRLPACKSSQGLDARELPYSKWNPEWSNGLRNGMWSWLGHQMARNKDSVTGDGGGIDSPRREAEGQLRGAKRDAQERESVQCRGFGGNQGTRPPTGCGIGWLLLGATETSEEAKQSLRVVNRQAKPEGG